MHGVSVDVLTVTGAAALFAHSLQTLPSQEANLVRSRWARYLYQYGDLGSVLSLERQMVDSGPKGASCVWLSCVVCPDWLVRKRPVAVRSTIHP